VLAGSLTAAVIVILLLAAGVLRAPRPTALNPGLVGPGPVGPALGPPGPYLVTGKKFAHLTAKQIGERIEKANHKVIGSRDGDGTSLWVLSGNDRRVARFCSGDPQVAAVQEIQLSKQVGATARDGNCVLNVHLPAAEARALLDQIAR
jgi:hypothetical protein